MELEEVADELYAVPPDEFIALRTTRQDQAKAEGDKAMAKAIGSLPKPSTAAWVCNLLVRAHREEIEGLVELGDLLRDAQHSLAGDQLRVLNTQRGQLLNALTRQASALARERGHRIGTSISAQVEDTLRAAMADPEAGEALLTGRLPAPMSYSGMGTVSARPDLRLVPPSKAEKRTAPTPPRTTTTTTKAGPQERESPAARREREREEQRKAAEEKHVREVARAQEAAALARALVEEAQAAAQEQRRQAEQLALEHAELRSRVEELADQLAEAERHAAEAAAALKRAQRRSSAAEHEAADAADAADRAEAHLQQVQAAGPR